MTSLKNEYDRMNVKGSDVVRLIKIGECTVMDIESLHIVPTRREYKASAILQLLLSLTNTNEVKRKTS